MTPSKKSLCRAFAKAVAVVVIAFAPSACTALANYQIYRARTDLSEVGQINDKAICEANHANDMDAMTAKLGESLKNLRDSGTNSRTPEQQALASKQRVFQDRIDTDLKRCMAEADLKAAQEWKRALHPVN